MVSYTAAKLDIILVPVPPQNRLDLTRERTFHLLMFRFLSSVGLLMNHSLMQKYTFCMERKSLNVL